MFSYPFEIIPNELICLIGECVPDAKSLNCIIKCNRHLLAVLTPFLNKIAVEDYDGLPAIHWAARQGHKGLVKLLINEKGVSIDLEHAFEDNGVIYGTPLDYAIKAGQFPMVEFLLENGATVNIPDAESKRIAPIYVATRIGLTELHHGTEVYGAIDEISAEKGLVMAKILLDHGANPNCTLGCITGDSVLQSSATYGHTNMVKLLLENGADVNLTDEFGKTALHKAITGPRNNGFSSEMCIFDIVELLGWWGADVFAEDSASMTAIDYATNNGLSCIVDCLREYWFNCFEFVHQYFI